MPGMAFMSPTSVAYNLEYGVTTLYDYMPNNTLYYYYCKTAYDCIEQLATNLIYLIYQRCCQRHEHTVQYDKFMVEIIELRRTKATSMHKLVFTHCRFHTGIGSLVILYK